MAAVLVALIRLRQQPPPLTTPHDVSPITAQLGINGMSNGPVIVY